MAYVVKCAITNEYFVASKAKNVNLKDPEMAKRYGTKRGAATYHQGCLDYWDQAGLPNCKGTFEVFELVKGSLVGPL